jgi:hypothetical protein
VGSGDVLPGNFRCFVEIPFEIACGGGVERTRSPAPGVARRGLLQRTRANWPRCAEAVTRIAQQHIDDSLYQKALETFTGKELVDFTLAIVAINGWNRLNISFRIPPGYQF